MYAICFNSEQISEIYFAKENLTAGHYHCYLSGDAHKQCTKTRNTYSKELNKVVLQKKVHQSDSL